MAADGEAEQGATVDGLDDLLSPHGGAVDVGFIHPDVEALFAKIVHQPVHLLLILARIADEYVLVHCALLSFAYLFDKRLILGIILIIHDEKIEFEVEWQRVVFVSLLSKFHEFVESNFDN